MKKDDKKYIGEDGEIYYGPFTIEEFKQHIEEPLSFWEKLKLYLLDKPIDLLKKLKFDTCYGVCNLFRFFKVVWAWRDRDSYYEYMILKKVFELKIKRYQKGIELEYEGMDKDIKILNRMKELLDIYEKQENFDDYKLVKEFLKIYKQDGYMWY